MTDDILDWLKMWAEYSSVKAAYGDKISRAANEIDRLRAENERLRAALAEIGYDFSLNRDEAAIEARKALR